jgi:hypothetical protein
MDLGTGIANAGNLFSQAIMNKHEEEQRLQREALAQRNQEAEMRWRMGQLERQQANDAYNASLRTVQFAPEGASLSPETAMQLDPLIRDTYTRHAPAELPARNLGMGSQAAPRGERYDILPPYRKEEAVANIRRDATTTAARIGAESREQIAANALSSLDSYRKIMSQIAATNSKTAMAKLAFAKDKFAQEVETRLDLDLADRQLLWETKYAPILLKDPDFKPLQPRPTTRAGGGAGKTGTPKVSLDDAATKIGAGLLD